METIRFYEREGLLSEGARTEANYRLYTDAHVERLAFIRRCRLLDIPLDQVRILLRFRDVPRQSNEAGALLMTCMELAAVRIRELTDLMTELKKMHRSARTSGPGS